MPTKLALSIIIPTYQEKDNLSQLLPLLDFAQEILVIDSFSNDGTQTLAQKFGAKVLERHYTSPANQKNWAMQQAQFDWILILDADERPKPELAQELAQILHNPQETCRLFWLKRENYFMNRRIRFSGWQGDKVLRFLHRAYGQYPPEQQVHEEIDTQGQISKLLKSPLEHYTYKSLSHFIAKQERYARWSAQDRGPKTGRITWFHLLVKPAFRFLKHFIWQAGWLDGHRGLLISTLAAWSVFLRYAYLWESRQNKKQA